MIKQLTELERSEGNNLKAYISDLVRYRIIHNFGGFYFDM
jgi:hypothetical protein